MLPKIYFSFSLCLLLGVVSCTKKVTPPPPPPPPVAFTSPTPEQMEAAFKKASTTTAEHVLLKDSVGKWNATTSMWMDPNGKPQVSKGTAVVSSILNGKFFKEDYSGKFMGQKFNGIGLTGYDTVSKELNSVWIDSMGTMMMVMNGGVNLEKKTLSLSGAMSCPMASEKIKVRAEAVFTDKNHRTFSMYSVGPDGKEFKTFEITYVRAGKK